MGHRCTRWLFIALAFGLLNGASRAQDGPSKTASKFVDKAAAKKPDVVKVEKGPLTAAITLKGTVQVDDAEEVSVRLKGWSGPLTVQKGVEHGTPVKAGDVLVEFDPEKLDHALRDARQARDLALLAIRQAELEQPLLERQTALELAAAERTNAEAADDLKYFLAVGRPQLERSAAYRLKMANYFVESAKEELKQLEKMYRDKDLTEETEKFILRRYQFMLELEEHFLRETKIDNEHLLKVTLPRREQAAHDAVAKAEIALAKARDVQPLHVKQKRLTLAKLHYDDLLAKEKLVDLEKDRAALTVKAPCDGLAYHGRFFRGHWIVSTAPTDNAVVRGSNINPGIVFMTVVPRNKLVVRAEAEEKDLAGLTPGLSGRLTPTAFPEEKLVAKLNRVARAPLNGKFEVTIEPESKTTGSIVPGMTCTIRFVTARNPNALTVPASAVFEDADEEIHYVYRPGSTPEKQTVRVGRRSGDRIEIVSGLSENDEIRASKP